MKRLLLALMATLLLATGAQAVVSTAYVIDDFTTTGPPIVINGTTYSTPTGWGIGPGADGGFVETPVPGIWGSTRQTLGTLHASTGSYVELDTSGEGQLRFGAPEGRASFNVSYFNGPSDFSNASSFTIDFSTPGTIAAGSQLYMKVANFDGAITLYSAHHVLTGGTGSLSETFLFSEFGGADFSDIARIVWGFSAPIGGPTNVTFASVTSDMAPTPIPGAIWLLGSGLAALFGIRRKRS